MMAFDTVSVQGVKDPFQDIGQFPDIPRPRVAFKTPKNLRSQSGDLGSQFIIEGVDQVMSQDGDIFFPFP
jgi:hypothetical protein